METVKVSAEQRANAAIESSRVANRAVEIMCETRAEAEAIEAVLLGLCSDSWGQSDSRTDGLAEKDFVAFDESDDSDWPAERWQVVVVGPKV